MKSSKNPVKSQSEDYYFNSKEMSHKNADRSTLSQVVAMFVMNILIFDFGLELNIQTVVIGSLHKNPTEELNMTDEQASWFGSLVFFAHPIGALISGFLQEHLGRRRSLLLVNIPMFVAWTTLHLASSVYQLYFVSATLGLCIGFCEAPLHSYIGEMSEPHLRGTLSAMGTASGIMGQLVMYIIGYLFPWRRTALLCSFVPIITFLCMTQIPESPTWLIMNSRKEDAKKSLSWLRGWVEPTEVQKEFQRLLDYTENKAKLNRLRVSQKAIYEMVPTSETGPTQAPQESNESYWRTKLQHLTDKKLYLPLRMLLIVFIFSNGTQLTAMRPFMVGILRQFGLPVDNYLILVFISFFFFVGAILNVAFVRRLGKRQLALFCQAVASLSILLIGVYCSISAGSNRVHGIVWIPISLFVIVFFCSGFSITLLPWQLCVEVFPVEGRGTAQGLGAAWAYYVGFAMSGTYLYLESLIELDGVFYFYGTLSVVGFLYFWHYLPETEGKSLELIETYFTANCDEIEKYSKRKHNHDSGDC